MDNIDWYDKDMEILAKAMIEAKKRFDEYINNEKQLEGAYFELDLTGYLLDSSYQEALKKIEMDFQPSLERHNKEEGCEHQ